jgi:hypothetical protein
VDDAADRGRAVGVAAVEQILHRVRCRHVEGDRFNGHTAGLQRADRRDPTGRHRIGDRFPLPTRRQSGASGQDQSAGATVGKPVRRQQAECAQTTGDEVGRVGPTS